MNAKDILNYGQRDALAAFEHLTTEQWNTLVNTHWMAKDVLAHLVSSEVMTEEALNSLVAPAKPKPVLEDMAKDWPGFNDRQVDARKSQSSAELLSELRAT